MVPGLNLLLQVMLHAHGQLVQLIPLLRQPHRAVLRVAVVQDEVFLERSACGGGGLACGPDGEFAGVWSIYFHALPKRLCQSVYCSTGSQQINTTISRVMVNAELHNCGNSYMYIYLREI
jgi:hypothetical protein